MENINVYIRLKPNENNTESSFTFDEKTIKDTKANESLTFDYIISPSQTNKDIFEKFLRQNISSLLKGTNISILLYGQTKTGKTFTLKGDSKTNEGIIHSNRVKRN